MAVPNTLPVSIDGREYLVDVQRLERQSLPVTRQQIDTKDTLGEHSISPMDLWRRSQSSWHLGAGQVTLDLEDSSPFRFRSSIGINPWEKNQISLLRICVDAIPTPNPPTTPGTVLGKQLVVAGSYLYVLNFQSPNATLHYTTDDADDTPTWTQVTGPPAVEPAYPNGMVTDGFNVYTAFGASGIYKTTRGAATTASYVTGTVTRLGFAKGRLLATTANSIYNVTAAGALPTALFTHNNTDFIWIGFAEGINVIYAAGYAGNKSFIYRIGLKPDGTSLSQPIVAAELPDGERISAIYGYMGYILIGSNRGIRLAEPDGAGNLLVGPAFNYISPGDEVGTYSGPRPYFTGNPTSPVSAFEGEGRFVWFGWSTLPETDNHVGLGRIDLSRFTGPLTPAYSSDLQYDKGDAVTSSTVFSIVTHNNLRVFSYDYVSSGSTKSGIAAESRTIYEPSGSLYSGNITYGLTDSKSFEQIELLHRTDSAVTTADIGVGLEVDGSSRLTASASVQPVSTTPFMTFTPTGTKKGREAEVEIRLERSTDTLETPVVSHFTLRSMPIARRGEQLSLPLILRERIQQRNGVTKSIDPKAEFDALKTIETTGTSVTVKIGDESFSAFVDGVSWGPDLSFTEKGNKLQGLCTVLLRRFY